MQLNSYYFNFCIRFIVNGNGKGNRHKIEERPAECFYCKSIRMLLLTTEFCPKLELCNMNLYTIVHA